MDPIVPRLRLRMETWLKKARLHREAVAYQSANQNIYHCTVQKTASQWMRAILSDPRVYRYCGLYTHRYEDGLPGRNDERTLIERRFDKPFPVGAIASPLYCDYQGFSSIPKPLHYKGFFVTRDPRDLLVSWYFSAKISHPLMGDLGRVRQDLNRLSEEDGLVYSLEYLDEVGLFAAQRSWVGADAGDEAVLLLRYEDLIGPESQAHFERLFAALRFPRAPSRNSVTSCSAMDSSKPAAAGQGRKTRPLIFAKVSPVIGKTISAAKYLRVSKISPGIYLGCGITDDSGLRGGRSITSCRSHSHYVRPAIVIVA